MFKLMRVTDEVWLNPYHIESVEKMLTPTLSGTEVIMISGQTLQFPKVHVGEFFELIEKWGKRDQ